MQTRLFHLDIKLKNPASPSGHNKIYIFHQSSLLKIIELANIFRNFYTSELTLEGDNFSAFWKGRD